MTQRRWREIAVVLAATLAAACAPSGEGAPVAPGRALLATGPGWPVVADAADGPAWPVRRDTWPHAEQAPPIPARIAWPAGLSAELEPTGLDLVGGSGQRGVVVDGAGMVWVHGPWQVARVDPRTGEGDVWDAQDDAAFGRIGSIARSATSGTWLVAPDRLLLFDGSRFVVDLAVPPVYRGGSGVRTMVERRGELWIGTDAGVARWSDGQWAVVGLGQVSDVVTLAVDSEGTVWVSGRIATTRGARRGVAVFDGRSWAVPAEASAPFAPVDEIEADPTGGVVVRAGALASRLLYRFESGTWTDLTDELAAARPGALGADAVTVSTDGRIWVVGDLGVATRGRFGGWDSRPGGGSRRGTGDGAVTGVVHAGGALIASDGQGLVRLESGSPVRLWTDPALPGGDVPGDGTLQAGLVAVSALEAWVDYRPSGMWLPRMVRYAPRGWSTTDPPQTAYGDDGLSGIPVRATDGALWQVTAEGLARFDGRRWSVIDPALVGAGFGSVVGLARSPFRAGGALPGPEGSLWLSLPAGALVEIRPDGSQRRVELPRGAAGGDVRAAAGVDGGPYWVLIAGIGAVPRAAGRWGPAVPLPKGFAVGPDAAIGGDGALWATLRPVADGREQVLARLADERWQVVEEGVVGLSPAEVGVCGLRGRHYWSGGPTVLAGPGHVVCFGAQGLTEEVVIPLPADAVAVAPDGGVWVVGEQLARLPVRVGRAQPGRSGSS